MTEAVGEKKQHLKGGPCACSIKAAVCTVPSPGSIICVVSENPQTSFPVQMLTEQTLPGP